MILLYNALLVLLSPLWVPWMWLRARQRGGEKVNWRERRGRYAPVEKPGERTRIWIHAVSVGEVIAARPILSRLRNHPSSPEIVLSVTTSSGHETARQTPQLFDHLRYAPIDLLRFTLPAVQATRPHVLAIMETELWLNWLEAAKIFDAGTLLLNGRISDRSFRGARRILPFYRAVLARVDRALMQSDADTDRIRTLGAKEAMTFGNVKFDEAREATTRGREAWREELGWPSDAFVIVVGSTRGEEEEQLVVAALAQLPPSVSILHAPRHLERVGPLDALIRSHFGEVGRRSEGTRGARYVLLDTYGELADAYGAADIAVVGGGFAPFGGQNILQPLARGIPTVHGPYMANFRDVSELATAAGATAIAATTEELVAILQKWMNDPVERARRGEAALALFAAHAGAADRYVGAILESAAEARARMERRAARYRRSSTSRSGLK